jgi:hypothetical protein
VYTFFYTIFTFLPSFPAASPLPLVPASYPLGRTCSALLFSDFVEEKRDKKEKEKHVIFACLR